MRGQAQRAFSFTRDYPAKVSRAAFKKLFQHNKSLVYRILDKHFFKHGTNLGPQPAKQFCCLVGDVTREKNGGNTKGTWIMCNGKLNAVSTWCPHRNT